jgi:hypothetical protein
MSKLPTWKSLIVVLLFLLTTGTTMAEDSFVGSSP